MPVSYTIRVTVRSGAYRVVLAAVPVSAVVRTPVPFAGTVRDLIGYDPERLKVTPCCVIHGAFFFGRDKVFKPAVISCVERSSLFERKRIRAYMLYTQLCETFYVTYHAPQRLPGHTEYQICGYIGKTRFLDDR